VQKIVPCLWFDNQAEEAVKFYTSLIKPSKIGAIARYGETGPGPAGSVMTVEFELAGQHYLALNGGPIFKFTEALSLMVNCETQQEIDRLWEKLSEGGEKSQCGWLKDRYGLSWQIVPTVLRELVSDRDPARTQRVMKALLQMRKLDIKDLKRAYDQKK
jgi:predicted 3-demethylubiquinone-9 3-methyltransferase (glyoxalase superfamily)